MSVKTGEYRQTASKPAENQGPPLWKCLPTNPVLPADKKQQQYHPAGCLFITRPLSTVIAMFPTEVIN